MPTLVRGLPLPPPIPACTPVLVPSDVLDDLPCVSPLVLLFPSEVVSVSPLESDTVSLSAVVVVWVRDIFVLVLTAWFTL